MLNCYNTNTNILMCGIIQSTQLKNTAKKHSPEASRRSSALLAVDTTIVLVVEF